MSIIDELELKRRQIDVDKTAMVRSVLGQINQLTRQIYGDPKSSDSGIFMRLRVEIDNPRNNFPPFNTLLPTYLNSSRELLLLLNTLRRYYEGGGDDEFTKVGIINRYDDLVMGCIEELRSRLENTNDFEKSLNDQKEEYEAIIRAREEDVKNYKRQVRLLEAQVQTYKGNTTDDSKLVASIYKAWITKFDKPHQGIRNRYKNEPSYRLSLAASLFMFHFKKYLEADVLDLPELVDDPILPSLKKESSDTKK